VSLTKEEVIEFLRANNISEKSINRFDNGSQSPPRDFVQVYGLPRTGTNFATNWVQFNYDIFFTKWFGYKHAAPFYELDWTGSDWHRPHGQERPKQVASAAEIFTEVNEAIKNKKFFFIMTVKNPYSWYLSNLSFGGQGRLNRRGEVRIQDGTNNPGVSWMVWYNERNWEYINYFKARPETSIIIKYEDYLKKGADSIIKSVGDKFNLTRKTDEWVVPDYVCGRHSDFSPEPNADGMRYHNWSLYKEKKYLDLLNDKAINFINNNVDKEIMEFFGYEYENLY